MLKGKGLSERLKKAKEISEVELSTTLASAEQDLLQSKFGKEAMALFKVALQYACKTALVEEREPYLSDVAEKFLELTPKRKKRKSPICLVERRRYLQTY